MRKSARIVSLAMLLSASLVFELMPKVRAPWGMSIDFVAVPILVAFFAYGVKEALALSAGLWVMLCLLGFGSFVGGTMKVATTIPTFLVPAGLASLMGLRGSTNLLSEVRFASLALPCALATRCAVAVVLNYFWAVPLFWGQPIEALIDRFFFGSLWGFIWFVSAMNITQGAVDYLVGWAASLRILKLRASG